MKFKEHTIDYSFLIKIQLGTNGG